ncbi:MAG TPA: helix-turn-helix domain-containing protein [Bradyrhizobium sp.]|jgi:AraC family ethanolamine operon transcriptional activator
MGEDALEPSLTPKIFRFSDIDHFRSSVRGLNVEFTPFARKISAEQIILNLGGCDLNVTRAFPRIVDAQLLPNCTAVGFTMDDGIPIRFNGVERDRSVIVIGTDGAAYTAVERVERRYASIVFTPSIRDRGWPVATSNFNMFETSPTGQHRLRELVIQILSAAPQLDASASVNETAAAIRESLLACVDSVFAEVLPTKWASHANSTRQFKIFQDIRAVLAGSLGKPIYSEDLARQIGISVRSMHDAILRYRGMSLHRYLRLRRLWLVRQQLLAGAESVKATALAFGFWHLGDFSGSYRLQFGEPPSQTLARSRNA